MTDSTKRRLRTRFFKALGPNAATFKAMMDAAPLLCVYMKDAKGRIMALNRRNCDVCNIKDEWDAIGLRSDQIFPAEYAEDYMALDKEVLATGKPVLQRITEYPADRSMNFMISDVYPLRDTAGRLIGTARAYRLTSDTRTDSGRYGRMRAVSRYIAEHYAEPINLPHRAALAGMSLSCFKRLFTVTFSMSPGRYVLTVRINAARHLLENTDKLVSDIASECGFFDQSHFSKAFTRIRGVTPGTYRRQHRRRNAH